MKTNMGSIDRALRILAAVLVVVLYFTNVIYGTVGIVLLVLAGILVITALVSFCPIYSLFSISTEKKKIRKAKM